MGEIEDRRRAQEAQELQRIRQTCLAEQQRLADECVQLAARLHTATAAAAKSRPQMYGTWFIVNQEELLGGSIGSVWMGSWDSDCSQEKEYFYILTNGRLVYGTIYNRDQAKAIKGWALPPERPLTCDCRPWTVEGERLNNTCASSRYLPSLKQALEDRLQKLTSPPAAPKRRSLLSRIFG